MRLALMLPYGGPQIDLPLALIQQADRMGVWAVWVPEVYGLDGVATLAWIGARTGHIRLGSAILQIPARTPAATASAAITLDQLSGGRALLGLGVSGPQVAEGWHGQPFTQPLTRTREYVAIIQTILRRQEPARFDGQWYRLPYDGPDASGLGKPLKSILHGRADLPIYLAANGPKNVALAAEIAQGWLPMFFAPRHYERVFCEAIENGFIRAAAGKSYADFDIAPSVMVATGEDVAACRARIKPVLALYIGGMGAPGQNFYHALAGRYGYADAADRIQALYLAGRKAEAAAAVPDKLVDEVALAGPPQRIAAQLAAWQDSPVTTLNAILLDGMDGLRVMGDLLL